MAKKFALQQAFRERRTIYRSEWFKRAVAAVMQRARHQLLARAGFAGNQNRGVEIGQILQQTVNILHGLISAHKILKLIPFTQFALHIAQERDIANNHYRAHKISLSVAQGRTGNADHLLRAHLMLAFYFIFFYGNFIFQYLPQYFPTSAAARKLTLEKLSVDNLPDGNTADIVH
ncbi:MAG: hypothetical protein BWY90_01064 [Deltaproteobacteria bacterium ADurb.BinA014]|nr:MAG: hypothetical protein BWY90_01064 [Deltaproteobacteria bacterium ADurb.BinA014]